MKTKKVMTDYGYGVTSEKPFGDGAHIIYVNGAKVDDTELGRLMHDFKCTESKDMYNKVLAERVRYFKETEKGESCMCEIVEKLIIEREINAGARGEKTGVEKMARQMQLMGYSEEEINNIISKIPQKVA